MPRDVLQFVPTRDDEVGRRLVTHDGVDAVILTGSFDTARLFMRLDAATSTCSPRPAARTPSSITASADIDLAVRTSCSSAFGHAGQKCSAASLAIVERGLLDDPALPRQLRDAVREPRASGPPPSSRPTVGPDHRAPEDRADAGADASRRGRVAGWSSPAALDDAGLLWRPGVRAGRAPGLVESPARVVRPGARRHGGPRPRRRRSRGRTRPTSASPPGFTPSTRPSASTGSSASRLATST